MNRSFDPDAVAQFILSAHEQRDDYRNVAPEIAPGTVAEAYAAQDALVGLLEERHGGVAGFKIATTTPVMQRLMGIDHPCGGVIFASRVHGSPARLRLGDYIHLMIECELAVRLGGSIKAREVPHTADSVRDAVATVMPAFELIEDRNADYKLSRALSLIADNCWNAGVVLGSEQPFAPDKSLAGIAGSLRINGKLTGEGRTDDPLGALAWIANLVIARGRSLEPGMVVITGSVVPTVAIAAGDHFAFELDGLGATELSVS
jgi:2-keto-4-pentenoate hydratase